MKTLELLDRLISFETVSAQSNLPLISFVEAFLKSNGFRVSRIPSPCGLKAGLYAEIGPEGEGGLLLSAHTDVVPVEGQTWTRPPFRLTTEKDKLFGRGTTDMKGFVASALALAARVDAERLHRPLAILLSYDEEIGCVGLQQMQPDLAPLLRPPALCIVGEPTQMQVATGHKGKTAYKATFTGEAGHSALAPKFRNALHLAADFMSDLRVLQDEFSKVGPFDAAYDIPYSTVHVGKLSGGMALNVVPAEAEMRFEIRNLADQDMTLLNKQVAAFAERFNEGAHAARATVEITNSYPGLEVARNQSWVQDVVLKTQSAPIKVAFGTEAGLLSGMGVPTLVCGPGLMEGQGHKADEFILESQLSACDDLLERLVEEL
ncbi:acetylornithine deacetylase [Gymnodinialimonas hymeniacidonis]|uniref:acetylornithine deacetylase n=1 Tax=Gymnodinialimonas hymeniacidonis TaxID=3126508 RepID=UPI0034C63B03